MNPDYENGNRKRDLFLQKTRDLKCCVLVSFHFQNKLLILSLTRYSLIKFY